MNLPLRAALAVASGCIVGSLAGCAKQTAVEIPCTPADLQGCVVDRVEIDGNHALEDDEIEEKIATAETGGSLEGVPILGAIDWVGLEYQRFDRFVLERDLERIRRFYRAKGYYEAVVRAGRVVRMDDRKSDDPKAVRVLVHILVEEGEPVKVGKVTPTFTDWGAEKVVGSEVGRAVANALIDLQKGPVFTEEQYEAVRKQIQRSLTDLGYAYARVEGSANVDLATHRAEVGYTIEVGPKCTFGPVAVEGLGEIPEWQVRPALGFEQGDRYSTRKLEEAEIALSEFGVFGSIAIEPELADPKRPTAVPVKITAQPGSLRAVRLGGGIELGGQVAAHGIAGWENKNMFGALDRFNVEARPRIVVYPRKLSTLFDTYERPDEIEEGEGAKPTEPLPPGDPVQAFPVYEVIGRLQYSLPIPRDPRTVAYVQGQGSVALEQNHDTPDLIFEETNIPGEYLVEQRVGVERRFFASRLLVGLAHNLLYSQPFSYNLDDPPEKDALLLSYLDHYVEVDLRRGETGRWDALQPRSGFWGGVSLQMAGFVVGGDANDVKVRPELRFYAPLTKRLTLAGRFTMGFLFTDNYALVLDEETPTDDVQASDDASPFAALLRRRRNRDVQILGKRGLFSGGPIANRGYGFNEISPHRVLGDEGFLLPDPDAVGGRTLWEASVELRLKFTQELGGTVFVDASDVTRRLGELRIDHPHLSPGLGFRYDTPVGPLRIDLGVRVPYLQVAGEAEVESCTKRLEPCPTLIIDEGDASTLLGLPAALSIAIGHVY